MTAARPEKRVMCRSTTSGGTNTALTKALEATLQAISKILENTEKKDRQKRKAKAAAGVAVEPDVIHRPPKAVSFKAGSNSDRLVKAPHLPNRALADYLALPLDSYSLLDPRWISRDPQDPDLFHLMVPLQDLTGLALEPRVSIRVDVDAAHSQVHFHANQFSVGAPKFDRLFKVDMKANLLNRPVPEVAAFPTLESWISTPRTRKEQQQQNPATAPPRSSHANSAGTDAQAGHDPAEASAAGGMGTGSGTAGAMAAEALRATSRSHQHMTSTISDPPRPSTSGIKLSDDQGNASSSGNPVQEDAESSNAQLTTSAAILCGNVEVAVEVQVPYPLSVVPGPLLNLAATLVTKSIMQQLLPGFLQLLSVDYERWASGKSQERSQAAGSLLSNAAVTNNSTEAGSSIVLSVVDVEEAGHPNGCCIDTIEEGGISQRGKVVEQQATIRQSGHDVVIDVQANTRA